MDTHQVVSQAVAQVALGCRANGYPPASGDDSAKAAIAQRYTRPEAPLSPNVQSSICHPSSFQGCCYCFGMLWCP